MGWAVGPHKGAGLPALVELEMPLEKRAHWCELGAPLSAVPARDPQPGAMPGQPLQLQQQLPWLPRARGPIARLLQGALPGPAGHDLGLSKCASCWGVEHSTYVYVYTSHF